LRIINITLLFLSLLSFNLSAKESSLKVTWFGSTCLNISDGKSSLFFDPFLSRPSLFKVVSFQRLKSDTALINKWLSKLGKNKTQGIFISHTHYDHVLDLVSVQKREKAKVYGSHSVFNILKGAGLEKDYKKIVVGDVVKVGEFKVTILTAVHPNHFFSYILASGSIKKPLSATARANQYKVGSSYNFLIEHPKGKILFHPSGGVLEGFDFSSLGKVDLLVQGIAKRKSTKELHDKIIKPTESNLVIPVHYDDFFEPLEDGVQEGLSVDLSEFKEELVKLRPGLKVKELSFGEAFQLP